MHFLFCILENFPQIWLACQILSVYWLTIKLGYKCLTLDICVYTEACHMKVNANQGFVRGGLIPHRWGWSIICTHLYNSPMYKTSICSYIRSVVISTQPAKHQYQSFIEIWTEILNFWTKIHRDNYQTEEKAGVPVLCKRRELTFEHTEQFFIKSL